MRKIIQIMVHGKIVGLADDGTLWELIHQVCSKGKGKWVKLDIDESDLRWMKDETH